MGGSGKARNILDMNILSSRGQVNENAYLVLFSELVSYCRNRVQSVTELEQKLADIGYRIGRRSLELIFAREKIVRREINLQGILHFVSLNLWKFLFGKQADSLKKVRNSDEYYIEEAAPLVNKYISVPKDYGDLNCAAFCAGIINGVLDAAGFPADVAVKVLGKPSGDADADADDGVQPLTLYYIKFAPEVLEREKRLGH